MADTTSSTAATCLAKLNSYVKTKKGVILAAETLISFIIIICYAASRSSYSGLAVCEMIISMIFFVIFMMGIDKQILVINWVWSDFFRAAIGAVLYIITSLVCLIGGGDGALVAGGVFGLIAGILFAYDTYTIFQTIKSSRQHAAASTDDSV